MGGIASRMSNTIGRVYTPKYVLLNIAAAFFYYFVLTYLISAQQYGAVIITIPLYLFYALAITASVAFTIAVYSLLNTRNNRAHVSASMAGTVTTLVGGVFAGCGCTAPILFSLTAIGFTTTQVFALNSFISSNIMLLFLSMIAINLFVVIYYLNKLSNPACRIKKK
ncbi:MAG: hypothetical protein LVQ95_03565 [Candidatus Micrarchaeales archaeon]|nr:hypothetical protein [Candidatus Micrarchaeales archaeon]